MCEYQDYYRMMQSGQWAEVNPSKCKCRGTGWANSEVDTWHKCPIHGHGVPHPEDEHTIFDFAVHLRDMYVKAYDRFRADARRLGFKGNFRVACAARLTGGRTPADWVNAAETIVDGISHDTEADRARRMGYDNAFEMHMHEEAMIEQEERRNW